MVARYCLFFSDIQSPRSRRVWSIHALCKITAMNPWNWNSTWFVWKIMFYHTWKLYYSLLSYTITIVTWVFASGQALNCPHSHGGATSGAIIGLRFVSHLQQVLIHDSGCGDKGREETACSMFRKAWSGRVLEEAMELPCRRRKR